MRNNDRRCSYSGMHMWRYQRSLVSWAALLIITLTQLDAYESNCCIRAPQSDASAIG